MGRRLVPLAVEEDDADVGGGGKGREGENETSQGGEEPGKETHGVFSEQGECFDV
jgi:hypothetical protein